MKKNILKIILFLIINTVLSEKTNAQISPNDSLGQISSGSTTSNDPAAAIPSAKHPYKINAWISGGIFIAGSVGDVIAIPRILNKKEITDAELASLNPDVLTGFDRWALKQNSAKRVHYDKLSDNVLAGILILPFTLALDKDIRHDGWKLLLMYCESQAITFSIFNYSYLGPTFQDKIRPMAYYTDIPMEDRRDGNNRNSFFAGHVSTATSATFFMTKVYCDYHPEIGSKKYLLYAAATVPALAMGYLRVLALKHFPSDILAGMTIGAVSGIAIPALHKLRSKNINLGFYASPEGAMGLSMVRTLR
ncbi:MAG TPA: phosphatase PAP2 family protein [Bacteroidia bacterium]|nr:phosphatase PAP2 family protein [Bacteroidia bacterium]